MGFFRIIYNKLPYPAQNIVISAKGYLLETERINKQHCLNYFNFLKDSEKYSEDEMNNYQLKMLNNTIQNAFSFVPYYKKLKNDGIYIEKLKSLEEIKQIPILEKSIVKNSPSDFLDERFTKQKIRTGVTSGSTGSPMKYYLTKELFSKRWAFELRLRQWAGLKNLYSPKRAHFTGKNIFSQKHIARFNLPQNTMHMSSDFITEKTAAKYCNLLLKYNPELIDSYPSCLAVLSKLSLDMNLNLPAPKAIRVSGETLCPTDKELIEKAFRCKVMNQYGSRESTCFLSSNRNDQLVFHPEFSVVEQKRHGHHNTFEIITTCILEDNCMPLIRYRTGDLCEMDINEIDKKQHKINNIIGRMDDTLYIEDVGYIQRFSTVYKDIPEIVEAQIIYERKDLIRVKVVCSSESRPEVSTRLKQNIDLKVGGKAKVLIDYVNRIERGPNGKFKAVIDNTKTAPKL